MVLKPLTPQIPPRPPADEVPGARKGHRK